MNLNDTKYDPSIILNNPEIKKSELRKYIKLMCVSFVRFDEFAGVKIQE